MTFVNQVATAVEAAGHHPDIDTRWTKATLVLASPTEGRLTARDVQLAARIKEPDHPPSPPDHRAGLEMSALQRRIRSGSAVGLPALVPPVVTGS